MGIVKLDNLCEQGDNLNYRDIGKANPKAVTRIYSVRSRHCGNLLGHVKWYAQWRQYVFFPDANMIFDPKCLTEIAEYCKLKTVEQRERRSQP